MAHVSIFCILCTLSFAPFLTGCRSLSVDKQALLITRTDPKKQTEAETTPRTSLPEIEPQDDLPDSPTLSDYLRYAALHNPGLESRFREWRAAIERIPQAKALPDPQLTYGYFVEEVETRVGPQEHQIGISQRFPWFGKTADREDAAARSADIEHNQLMEAQLDLSYRVEAIHNELYFLARSADILGENIELLKQFQQIAINRYRVSAADHPDIIRLQVELGRLEDRLRQLTEIQAPHRARMNATMNRSPESKIPPVIHVRSKITNAQLPELLAIMQENNPVLRALSNEIAMARIQSALAQKEGFPDLTLGLSYTVIGDQKGTSGSGNGEDAVLASLSVNLPVWGGRVQAGIRESTEQRRAASSRKIEAMNQLTADLQQAVFDHHDSQRRVELYQDTLIPKATESLQACLGGFEQGTTDFLELVDTERTLLEFQLELERAIVDRSTSFARIEQLLGTSVPEKTENGRNPK